MADAFIAAVRKRLHPEEALSEVLGDITASVVSLGRKKSAPRKPGEGNPRPGSVAGTSPSKKPSLQQEHSCGAASSLTGPEARAAACSRKRVNENAAPCSSYANTASCGDGGSEDAANVVKRRKAKTTTPSTARGVRYRAHPSKAVLDRLTRASRHRLFLIEREGGRDGHDAVFAVMGANGNVYKCVIGTKPACTCPDFIKRVDSSTHGPCKHLIFIFMRVFKMDKEDSAWWQVRWLPEEVERVLQMASDVGAELMADEAVRRQYRAVSGDGADKETDGGGKAQRKPVDGDCPICFEDLQNGDATRADDLTTFCDVCGSNVHKTCIQNWARAKGKATCPLCQGDMTKDNTIAQRSTEYTNLAPFSSSHGKQMTLAELYADTHQYIGRQ